MRRVEAISNPCLRSLLANENYWLHCHLILTGFTCASLVTQLPVRRFCYSGPISNWHTVCIVLVRPALISLAFTASLSLLCTSIGPMISHKSIVSWYRTIKIRNKFFIHDRIALSNGNLDWNEFSNDATNEGNLNICYTYRNTSIINVSTLRNQEIFLTNTK